MQYVFIAAALAAMTALPALAEQPGLSGGLSFGIDRDLSSGSDTDLTLDGFLEWTHASGFYLGAAATHPVDPGEVEEGDLYFGIERAAGRLTWGVAYGLHLEDGRKNCCGDLEFTLSSGMDGGRSARGNLGMAVDGSSWFGGLGFDLPVGLGTLSPEASFDSQDDAYSASLSLRRPVTEALTATLSAGRDGDDRTNFAEVGMTYDLTPNQGLDVTLRDTTDDAPTLGVSFGISFGPP